MLEVKNLGVEFQNGAGEYTVAAADVSFELEASEILGIVGESGSGKSVTALSLLRLLPYPKARNSVGSTVLYKQRNLLSCSEDCLRQIRGREIAYIFQEPMSSLNPLHTIGNQLIENIKIHSKISHKRAYVKAMALLRQVDIPNPEERMKAYPFELSGGQRQRVMIAMAVSNRPKILVADEPTTALDVTIQAQIIELLLKLCKQMKMSMIFISHNLRLVEKIADKICVMQSGRIVEQGVTAQIFANPRHDYTKKLLDSLKIKEKQSFVSDKCLLQVLGAEVEYPLKKSLTGKVLSSVKALNKVDLQLFKGETLGVVGESGSGKTTLGMSLAHLQKYHGQVLLSGEDIKSIKNSVFRSKVQIVFQDPYNSLNPRMTIEQIVGEGLKIVRPELNTVSRRQIITQLLRNVDLHEDVLMKYPHEFSGGQRQRIAIARALAVDPEVIILDEPTSALDVTIQKQILELLLRLQKEKNLSYVFISHDMNAIKVMSDRVAVMKNGSIVEIGKTIEVLHQPQHDYTKQLIVSSL